MTTILRSGVEVQTLAEVERSHVYRVLRLVHGNKSKAARLLDIDRRTLYRKLARWEKAKKRRGRVYRNPFDMSGEEMMPTKGAPVSDPDL